MASSSEVLPWSTWPMMVTTGARGDLALGAARRGSPASLLAELDLLLEGDHHGLDAEVLGQLLGELGLEHVVDVGQDAALEQRLDQVLGLDAELLGELAHGHALGDHHRPVAGAAS